MKNNNYLISFLFAFISLLHFNNTVHAQFEKSATIPDNLSVSYFTFKDNNILCIANNLRDNVSYIYKSSDCGNHWEKIFSMDKIILHLNYHNDKLYFIIQDHFLNKTFIASSADSLKTIQKIEIPGFNREPFFDVFFIEQKIVLAYKYGLIVFTEGMFRKVNIIKKQKSISNKIIFFENALYANYGNSIVVSKDTCKTWQECLSVNQFSIKNFDFRFSKITDFAIINGGFLLLLRNQNTGIQDLFYCNSMNADSVKLINQNETSCWKFCETNLGVFLLPYVYNQPKKIYYFDNNISLKSIALNPECFKRGESILEAILCNDKLILGTTNGVYSLKNANL